VSDTNTSSNEEVYRRTLEQVRASLMPFLNGRSNDLAAANIRLIDEALARPAHETSDVTRMRNTLMQAGYTDLGGELWKPPLGPRPAFLDENLRLRAALPEEPNATPGAMAGGEPSIPCEGSRPRELL
jgi:hypothetical protein